MRKVSADQDLHAAFSSLREAEVPLDVRTKVLAEVSSGRRSPKRAWARSVRVLILVGVGVSAAGTATAALSGTFSTAALDSQATSSGPATRNLAPLLRDIADASRSRGRADAGAAIAASGSAAVRGTTVTHGRITVDVAVSEDRICFEPRSSISGKGQVGCFPIRVRNDTLPSITAQDSAGTWLVAVVPDDVRNVQVVASDGTVEAPTADRNVAIALLPKATRVATLRWTDAQGITYSRDLSKTVPGEDLSSGVFRADHE